MAGIPIGTALTGVAVEGLGVIPTSAATDLIYVAVTLSMFLRPARCQMSTKR